MNNKERELRQARTEKVEKLQELRNAKELEKMTAEERAEVKALVDEVKDLDEQIDIESRMAGIDTNTPNGGVKFMENNKDTKADIRSAFMKAIRGKELTPEERALVTTIDADGGYLVPEDLSTSITELKRQYKSAKDLVHVMPVGTLSGSYAVEDLSTMTDLINFNDDNTGLAEQQPKFKNVAYTVASYGAITPIANALLQDEKANLMGYIDRNFAKKAVRTENKKIFDALKLGKTAKTLADWKALKKSINKDIDPTVKAGAVIVTNQDGFDTLDSVLDSTGRPVLQPNPTNPTEMRFMGIPVHVFSNTELPSIDTSSTPDGIADVAPIFYGNVVEGVKFFDREVYEVKASSEAGFSKNQTLVRCIERFDVKQGDSDAYVYGQLTIA
jgi:HK97 family phage major capsid protein